MCSESVPKVVTGIFVRGASHPSLRFLPPIKGTVTHCRREKAPLFRFDTLSVRLDEPVCPTRQRLARDLDVLQHGVHRLRKVTRTSSQFFMSEMVADHQKGQL